MFIDTRMISRPALQRSAMFAGESQPERLSDSSRWSTLRSDHRISVQMIPHAEGVQEFWHPSGVRRLAPHDPVVYATLRPPATFFVTLRVTHDFRLLSSAHGQPLATV